MLFAMNSSKVIMFLTVLTLITVLTSACFITNCPPGGKRSAPSHRDSPKKQCTRCGPSGIGRCFGPEICCGPSIGCQIGNEFSSVCSTEDFSSIPCHNNGRTCAEGKGVCAVGGFCCRSDGCNLDEVCQQNANKMSNINEFK